MWRSAKSRVGGVLKEEQPVVSMDTAAEHPGMNPTPDQPIPQSAQSRVGPPTGRGSAPGDRTVECRPLVQCPLQSAGHVAGRLIRLVADRGAASGRRCADTTRPVTASLGGHSATHESEYTEPALRLRGSRPHSSSPRELLADSPGVAPWSTAQLQSPRLPAGSRPQAGECPAPPARTPPPPPRQIT